MKNEDKPLKEADIHIVAQEVALNRVKKKDDIIQLYLMFLPRRTLNIKAI